MGCTLDLKRNSSFYLNASMINDPPASLSSHNCRRVNCPLFFKTQTSVHHGEQMIARALTTMWEVHLKKICIHSLWSSEDDVLNVCQKATNFDSGKDQGIAHCSLVQGEYVPEQKEIKGEREAQVSRKECSSKEGHSCISSPSRAAHSCPPSGKEVVMCPYHVIKKRCL